MRNSFSRFQGENADANQVLVRSLGAVANKKGITTAQLSLAWVSALGPHIIPIPGSSKPERVRDNIATSDIKLTEEELAEISRVLKENPVNGSRYNDNVSKDVLHLWG